MKHVLLLALAALLTGCSTAPKAEDTAATIDQRARAASLIEGDTGRRTNFDDLATRAASADVVLIGEQHGYNVGLSFAAQLFEAIADKAPGAALALEFFERDEQVHLDDYLAGITDEDQFRKASGRSSGNYPEGHRRMVETAKAHDLPVIAANAPRRYVSLSRKEGYERLNELNSRQRSLFVIPAELPSGSYKDNFFAMMGGHQPPSDDPNHDAGAMHAMVEGFYRAQSLWDSTMADSIAGALVEGHKPVVLVVGQFHIDHHGGTIQMLEAAKPGLDILTVTIERQGQSLRDEDKNRADCIVYTKDPPKPAN